MYAPRRSSSPCRLCLYALRFGAGLSGDAANVDWMRVWANLTGLLILALVWIYVRRSNKNTAHILQEEIDALDKSRKA